MSSVVLKMMSAISSDVRNGEAPLITAATPET